MKYVILKGRNSDKPTNRFNNNEHNLIHRTYRPFSCNAKPFTKDNLHEFLIELIVESNESENDTIITEGVVDNNEFTLLVNSTTANIYSILEVLGSYCPS